MESIYVNQIAILYRALKEVADGTSHDLTLRQLLVLLKVGSNTNELTQQQLAEHFDAYKSTISKIISNLAGSEGSVPHNHGLGTLRVDMDPQDLRNRLISLSRDGERLLVKACKAGFPSK